MREMKARSEALAQMSSGRAGLQNAVPELYAARFTMSFTHETLVNSYHSSSLAGYLKSCIGGELPPSVWFHSCDEGVPYFGINESYSFVVYCLPSGMAALDSIIRGVRKRRPGTLDSRAFGPRWECASILDHFGEQRRIGRASDLCSLSFSDIDAEARRWNIQDEVYIRLSTPLQLLAPREGRARKGVRRFCRDASQLDGPLFLDRVRQSISAFQRRLGFDSALPVPDARMELVDSDLFWHGAQQMGADGSEKPVYGLGGLLHLRVSGADRAAVWLWLVLGQHLGIGQRRGFGLGRYRLEGVEGERSDRLPERSATVLSAAFSLANLDAAWDAIRNNKRKPAFGRELDKVTFGLPPDADQRTELARLAKSIVADEYAFPSLEGIIIDKPKGGQRALAVPPLLDRVLQRAVAQMLTRIVEPVMYAHSYGYRPGRNRMQARDLIQRLVREGYTWFFESDIDSFFDAVDHALIYNRLMSLLPDDPAVDRIMRWITAPVRYQGRLIQRGGLPQGSPLSPLLANLVLDDFDKDLVAAGFKPVRFADDFVVPCKSKEQAERAAEVVGRSLKEKGLTLNEDQSRVARFSDGLKFLGYRFLNDMAIETKRPRNPVSKPEEDPHPGSWLAGLTEDGGSSREPGTAPALPEHGFQQDFGSVGAQAGEARAGGTLLIISEPGSVLYTREGQLWRQSPDEQAISIAPWPELGGILLFGFQRVTQAVLSRAMDHQVPVYFTDGLGRLKGTLVSAHDQEGMSHWPAQLITTQSADASLQVARELVIARVSHQAQVLRRRSVDRADLRAFEQAAKSAMTAETLESLRGVEGSATRAYFKIIARLLPDWTGFSGRNRRPPRDPFNALLSLGYTVLYTQTETLIRLAGLHPAHGFYHQRRGRHAALASDLMEPFRHLVEGTAIAQLNRRQLGEQDFSIDAEKGCRLTAKARRAYFAALGRRLSGRMTASDGESATGHEHVHRQALRLREWLANPEPPFRATRLK